MPKITYQCVNGHQSTLERDEISRASITCDQCGEVIDRFNSNSIVGNATESESIQNTVQPKNFMSRLILIASIKRVQLIGFFVVSCIVGLIWASQLISQKPPEADTAPHAFLNNIEDIAYTQSIEATPKRGVYKINFLITNLGKVEQNQLPQILMDFYPEISKDARNLPQSLIPTAIFHSLEYAGEDSKNGFTSKQGVIEIEFPKGTSKIATCLTYIGVADMKSDRCQEKILNQLLSKSNSSTEEK